MSGLSSHRLSAMFKVIKVYGYSVADLLNIGQLRRNVRKAVPEFAGLGFL